MDTFLGLILIIMSIFLAKPPVTIFPPVPNLPRPYFVPQACNDLRSSCMANVDAIQHDGLYTPDAIKWFRRDCQCDWVSCVSAANGFDGCSERIKESLRNGSAETGEEAMDLFFTLMID